MLKKLGFVEVFKAVQDKVQEHTELPVYDAVPDNTPSPFYILEIIGKRPENTKTMWAEVFSLWIHVIAEEGNEKIKVYELIEDLEDALTEEIPLPDHVTLIRQEETGVQSLTQDETGEMHAIIEYEIKVSYGFKAKI